MAPTESKRPCRSRARRVAALAGLAIVLAWTATASSAEDLGAGWTPLADRELAELRGGFVSDEGILVSIGYENLVLVDGTVRSHTALDAASLRLTPDGIAVGPDSIVALGAIRDAVPATIVTEPGLSIVADGHGMLIQNQLSNRSVQHLRMMHIEIRNVPGLTSMNLEAPISQQVVGPVR